MMLTNSPFLKILHTVPKSVPDLKKEFPTINFMVDNSKNHGENRRKPKFFY